ncbi:MAG: hypothetical protein U0168_14285 [Nannocystaceae bacterium]
MRPRRVRHAAHDRAAVSAHDQAIFDDQVAPSDDFPAPSGPTPSGFSTELGARDFGEQDIEQVVYAAEDVAEAVVAVLPSRCRARANSGPTPRASTRSLDQAAVAPTAAA